MAMSSSNVPESVDQYIRSFPPAVRKMLQDLRKTIKAAAPKATEYIGYQMPAYKYEGPLAYFAGYKNHIGFYPSTSGITVFKEKLSKYKGAKGSVQFPLDQPLPLALVKKIIRYRVKENEAIQKEKKLKAKNKRNKV